MKAYVKNFYVEKRLGLATLNMDSSLSLPGEAVVKLKAKIDSLATWTIVSYISKSWIGCAILDSQSFMVSISEKGQVRSILKHKLTSNGYVNDIDDLEFTGIFTLHQAYAGGRLGIMLAIERDAAAI